MSFCFDFPRAKCRKTQRHIVECKMYRISSVYGLGSKKYTTLLYPVNEAVQSFIPQRNKRSGRSAGGYLDRLTVKFRQSNEGAPDALAFPKLTPQDVKRILTLNEFRNEFPSGCAIRSYDINKLPSNNPIEDRDLHGKLLLADNVNQYLFGVFDGHSGSACSQTLTDRLFEYIATALAPYDLLENITKNELQVHELLELYKNPYINRVPDYLANIYNASLQKFARETLASFDEHSVSENLTTAFTRLDLDILGEGLPNTQVFSIDTLDTALSGSCACVAYVDDTELYIANTGDCRAVMGVQIQDEEWQHLELSNIHDCQNVKEKRRILAAHPNESTHIIRHNRLFGELAPSRAFGDARYKWSLSEMKSFRDYLAQPDAEISMITEGVMPRNYKTPPYLTAEPEIIKHSLTPERQVFSPCF